MRVIFLKNVTAQAMLPEHGSGETVDRLIRIGTELECSDIVPISKTFSNLWLTDGVILIDVRNDYFHTMS